MRELIRHHAKLGVDQIKLSMSGEAVSIFGLESSNPNSYVKSRSQSCGLQRSVSSRTKKQLHVLTKVGSSSTTFHFGRLIQTKHIAMVCGCAHMLELVIL